MLPTAHAICISPSVIVAQTRTDFPLRWVAECGANSAGGGSLCTSGRTAVPTGASEEDAPAREQDRAEHSSSAICSAAIRLFCSRSGPSCIPCHGTRAASSLPDQQHKLDTSAAQLDTSVTKLTPGVKSSCRHLAAATDNVQAHTHTSPLSLYHIHVELGANS